MSHTFIRINQHHPSSATHHRCDPRCDAAVVPWKHCWLLRFSAGGALPREPRSVDADHPVAGRCVVTSSRKGSHGRRVRCFGVIAITSGYYKRYYMVDIIWWKLYGGNYMVDIN